MRLTTKDPSLERFALGTKEASLELAGSCGVNLKLEGFGATEVSLDREGSGVYLELAFFGTTEASLELEGSGVYLESTRGACSGCCSLLVDRSFPEISNLEVRH